MGQKEFKYDERYEALVEEIERINSTASADCQCYYSDPQPVQVGSQTDYHGNIEPLYVQVSTCANCGAKEIF